MQRTTKINAMTVRWFPLPFSLHPLYSFSIGQSIVSATIFLLTVICAQLLCCVRSKLIEAVLDAERKKTDSSKTCRQNIAVFLFLFSFLLVRFSNQFRANVSLTDDVCPSLLAAIGTFPSITGIVGPMPQIKWWIASAYNIAKAN